MNYSPRYNLMDFISLLQEVFGQLSLLENIATFSLNLLIHLLQLLLQLALTSKSWLLIIEIQAANTVEVAVGHIFLAVAHSLILMSHSITLLPIPLLRILCAASQINHMLVLFGFHQLHLLGLRVQMAQICHVLGRPEQWEAISLLEARYSKLHRQERLDDGQNSHDEDRGQHVQDNLAVSLEDGVWHWAHHPRAKLG